MGKGQCQIPRIGAQRVEAATLRRNQHFPQRSCRPAGMSRGKSGTMPCGCRRATLTILTAGIVGSGAAASAQTPEQFYAGKTIDFVIGYPPGGSNDTLARLLARDLGKHIPVKPTVGPKNPPGAGSFLAVNTIFNVSPKDGTVIGIGAPTIPLDEKLGTQGVRFKTAELNWIGRLDSLVNVVFMWKTSQVK